MDAWDVLKCYKENKMTMSLYMFASGSSVPQALCGVYSGVLRETLTYSSREKLFIATKYGKCRAWEI